MVEGHKYQHRKEEALENNEANLIKAELFYREHKFEKGVHKQRLKNTD